MISQSKLPQIQLPKDKIKSSPLIQSNYRHGAEHLVLFGTILSLAVILIVTGAFSAGTLAGVILIMLIASYFKNRFTMQRFLKQARQITASSDPQLWQLFDEAARQVPVPATTEYYVRESHKLNAFAIGFKQPYKIILNSALLNHFNDAELKSIIGHEMGHIRFGHTSWAMLTGVFEGQAHGFMALGVLIRFLFLFYSRLCEYSADRAGLIACGNLRSAISAELKLNLAGRNPDPSLIEKFTNLQESPDDSLVEDLQELASTHPSMKGRIKSLLRFADSPSYKAHLEYG